MNKKSSWRMSKHKRLALALAVVGTSGFLLASPNIASAEESEDQNIYDAEVTQDKSTDGVYDNDEETTSDKSNDDVYNNDEEITSNKSNGKVYDDEEFPPEYLDLNQFVVTADRTPVNRWATPANIITITDKDIEANHYQTLAEALNHVNGIIVPSLINVPIINGFEKVLILIDGHQLYNDGYDNRDTVELSAIPSMKNIKRIEIVKGGGSALYGSDAVTGIINIITKKGEKDEFTLDVNTGSWHQRNYELTNQGVRGDFSWFVSGGINESNDFNYPGTVARGDNPEAVKSDYSDKDFTARFNYRFDERNSITLSGAHINHKYNRIHTYLSKPTSRDKSMNYNDVTLVYNFKENTQAPGWLRYFNDSKTRNGMDLGRYDLGIIGDKVSKFRVQGVDYQNSWILGNHKIVTGLEWHQTKMEHWSWEGSQKLNNKALYVQDTISMGKKWKLLPGFRFDHNSEFGHQWSPKIAANYRADDETKIYASWGRVYKSATPYQLYSGRLSYVDEDGDTRYVGKGGNEHLRPEKGSTAIIGIEHDFDKKSTINANVFYANLKDAIDYDDDIEQFINVNNEKSRGFEITFKQKMNDDWSYDVGYNYTNVKGFDSVSGSFVQPRNTYSLGSHYNHGIWQANLLGTMGHGGLNSNYFNSRNYIILDFNVNCKVSDNASVYLKLNNLTNQEYSYYGKTYYKNGNLNSTFISPGRSFIIGADFKF